jgi:hypothetical protein
LIYFCGDAFALCFALKHPDPFQPIFHLFLRFYDRNIALSAAMLYAFAFALKAELLSC